MKRDIIIDADHIAYLVANSKSYQNGFDVDEDAEDDGGWGTGFDNLVTEPHKQHFKSIVNEYVMIAEVEAIVRGWKLGKTIVIMSDVRNFRFDLYDEYKNKRPSSSQLLSDIKKWARSEYHFEKNTEADDVVAYYVRKGGLGFTTDKDLFKGVQGIWYNSHYMHRTWRYTSHDEAEWFFKCQALAGDGVDGIPAIDGVGIITAEKLLKKNGSSWKNILQTYLDKGYSKKYMVTMVRLVAMNQWSPKKGVKLWKFPK